MVAEGKFPVIVWFYLVLWCKAAFNFNKKKPETYFNTHVILAVARGGWVLQSLFVGQCPGFSRIVSQ